MQSDYESNVKMEFISILDGVVDFMIAEDYSEEHLDMFIKHTTKLDLIRNQNILEVAPQYEQLFKSL